MAKAVKLADIAEKMHVSTVTVSKALSGQKGVSEEMREKIRQLADELGYRQPSAYRREETRQSYNIGVLIAEHYLDKYDSFYWQMYQLLATKAVAKESFTIFEVVTGEAEKKGDLPRIVQEQKVEGIVVIGRLQESYLRALGKNSSIPVVYLDFCDRDQNTDAIISDSFYGAYSLTNYLFDMGHHEIAYVGTVLATGSITDRYLGYMKAMMEHGVKIKEEWVIKDRDVDTVMLDPKKYFAIPDKLPSAFFCNSDLTASMLIRKLEERGLRIPQDVSVVGYDNFLLPGLSDVEITTYEVDMKEMVRRALNILLKKMGKENYRHGVSIVEGHLVVKDSVKKLS